MFTHNPLKPQESQPGSNTPTKCRRSHWQDPPVPAKRIRIPHVGHQAQGGGGGQGWPMAIKDLQCPCCCHQPLLDQGEQFRLRGLGAGCGSPEAQVRKEQGGELGGRRREPGHLGSRPALVGAKAESHSAAAWVWVWAGGADTGVRKWGREKLPSQVTPKTDIRVVLSPPGSGKT